MHSGSCFGYAYIVGQSNIGYCEGCDGYTMTSQFKIVDLQEDSCERSLNVRFICV